MAQQSHLRIVGDARHATADQPVFIEREPRYAVYLVGRIRRAGSPNAMAIKVRNVSAGGLMGECAYPPRIGEPVEVELPRLGLVMGTIRWGREGKVGIQFDGPVDPTLAFARRAPSMIMPPVSDWRRPGIMAAH